MTDSVAAALQALPRIRHLFSRVYRTPIEHLLNSEFSRFDSNLGLRGMARIRGDEMDVLDLLVVDAAQPGNGALRRFINAAKQQFKTIYVWEIWNPWLPAVLVRYGFYPVSERDALTGEKLNGYRWQLTTKEEEHGS